MSFALCCARGAIGLALMPVAARRQRQGSPGGSWTHREQRHHGLPGALVLSTTFVQYVYCNCLLPAECSSRVFIAGMHCCFLHCKLFLMQLFAGGIVLLKSVLFYHSSSSYGTTVDLLLLSTGDNMLLSGVFIIAVTRRHRYSSRSTAVVCWRHNAPERVLFYHSN